MIQNYVTKMRYAGTRRKFNCKLYTFHTSNIKVMYITIVTGITHGDSEGEVRTTVKVMLFMNIVNPRIA